MPMIARLAFIALAATLLAPAPAHAQKFQPGSPYICPNSEDSALDCYLDAVVHLYRMCRHVKSIEILEFGYADSQKGVNGAKSEYCVDKQKINIVRPYQAALRDATPWGEVVDHLRSLQAYWLDSMANLRWHDGEDGGDYEYRVDKVFEELSYKVDDVRVAFTTPPDAAGKPAAPVKAVHKAGPKGKTAARKGP